MKHIKKLSALLMCALIALSACITASAANYDGDTLIETGETGKLTIHLYEALKPYLDEAKTNKNEDGSQFTGTLDAKKYKTVDGGTVKIAGIKGTTHSGSQKVSSGLAVFDNLPVGVYEVSFVANTFSTTVRSYLQNYTFKVKVPTTKADGKGFNFDVHVYPKIQAVYGKLTFTKKDGSNGNAGLKGVTFGVYIDSGCKTLLIDAQHLPTGKITTGDNGTFTLTLAPGTYYLKELATASGYILNQEVIKVEIDGNKNSVKTDGYTYTTAELTNYKNNTSISKTVNDTKVIVGQEVTYTVNVTLPQGIQTGDIFKITDNLPAGLTGQSCTVKGVKSGNIEETIKPTVTDKYVITFNDSSATKVKDLANYKALKVVITATVNTNNAILLTDGITNTARYEYKPIHGSVISGNASSAPIKTGSVLIKKTTSDSKGDVTKAKFKLFTDSTCQTPATFYTDSALTKLGTEVSPNADGDLIFYGLEPEKTYYVLETQAPTGYELYGQAKKVTAVVGIDDVADTIVNEAKVALPFTGGVGAEVVVASGVLLMVAACFVLKKRVK